MAVFNFPIRLTDHAEQAYVPPGRSNTVGASYASPDDRADRSRRFCLHRAQRALRCNPNPSIFKRHFRLGILWRRGAFLVRP
jgi:hypothetical protein